MRALMLGSFIFLLLIGCEIQQTPKTNTSVSQTEIQKNVMANPELIDVSLYRTDSPLKTQPELMNVLFKSEKITEILRIINSATDEKIENTDAIADSSIFLLTFIDGVKRTHILYLPEKDLIKEIEWKEPYNFETFLEEHKKQLLAMVNAENWKKVHEKIIMY